MLSCDWSRFCGSYKYDVTTRGYKKTDKYSGRTPDLFILTSLLQVECTHCVIDIYNILRRCLVSNRAFLLLKAT